MFKARETEAELAMREYRDQVAAKYTNMERLRRLRLQVMAEMVNSSGTSVRQAIFCRILVAANALLSTDTGNHSYPSGSRCWRAELKLW
jgi:hypothetical protein